MIPAAHFINNQVLQLGLVLQAQDGKAIVLKTKTQTYRPTAHCKTLPPIYPGNEVLFTEVSSEIFILAIKRQSHELPTVGFECDKDELVLHPTQNKLSIKVNKSEINLNQNGEIIINNNQNKIKINKNGQIDIHSHRDVKIQGEVIRLN